MASTEQSTSTKPRPNARMRACLRILQDDYDRVLHLIQKKLPKGYELIRTNTVDKTNHRWAYIVGPTYSDNPKDSGLHLDRKMITDWVTPPGWPPHWVVDLVSFSLEPVPKRQAPKFDYSKYLRGRKTRSARMLALVGAPASHYNTVLETLSSMLPGGYEAVGTDYEDTKGRIWVVIQGPTVTKKSTPSPFTWEETEVTAPVEPSAAPPCWLAKVGGKLKLERLPIEDLPDQPFKISNKT